MIIQRLSTFNNDLVLTPSRTRKVRLSINPRFSSSQFGSASRLSIMPQGSIESFRRIRSSVFVSKPKSEATSTLLQWLRSPQWEILMSILTAISLVAEDVRILLLGIFDDAQNAKIFSAVYVTFYTIMCFVFLVELILRMYEDRKYFDVSYLKLQPAPKKCTFGFFWETLSRARKAFSKVWLYDFFTVVTMLIEISFGISQTLKFFSAQEEDGHENCSSASLKACAMDGVYAPLPFFEDENSSTFYLRQITAVDITTTDDLYKFEARTEFDLLKVMKYFRIVARIGRMTSKMAPLCATCQTRRRHYVSQDIPAKLPVIGQYLGEKVTHHFILLVLFTLFALPFVELLVDFIVQEMATCARQTRLEFSVLLANAHTYGIANLTSSKYNQMLTSMITDLITNSSFCVSKLNVASAEKFMDTKGYLCSKIFTATTVMCSRIQIQPEATPLPGNNPPWLGTHTSFAKRSVYEDAVWRSVSALVSTVAVLALLAFGSFMLVNRASRLVLGPLGTMMSLVQDIKKFPLNRNRVLRPSDKLETTLLINRIRNLSALLRMVFGDVAPRWIYSVLTRDSNNTLNTLQNGEKNVACFGLCRNKLVHHSMRELKRYHSVLTFAHICAKLHWGHVIKSYQDSCMLVWRQKDLKIRHSLNTKSGSESAKPLPGNRIIPVQKSIKIKTKGNFYNTEEISSANDAIVAAIKTIAFDLSLPHESGSLSPDNSSSSSNASASATGVIMGLHSGWSIKAIMGSDVQFNISHLSVHRDMVHTLTELAEHVYKVPLIMSGEFRSLLAPHVQALCRHIDRVMLDQACGWDCVQDKPMDIYTIDFCLSKVSPENRSKGENSSPRTENIENIRKRIRKDLDPFSLVSNYSDNIDYPVSDVNDAIASYLRGDWDSSYPVLKKYAAAYGESIEVIVEFMDQHRRQERTQPDVNNSLSEEKNPHVQKDFVPPKDWLKGRRVVHPRCCMDSWIQDT